MITQKIYLSISQASILVPLAFGAIYYDRLLQYFKLLFIFLILGILFEIQANVAVKLFHNNMPGLHLYTLLETLTFSFIYFSVWSGRKILAIIVCANVVVFIGLALADAFLWEGLLAPNTNSRTFSSIFLSIYALIYFYDLFTADSSFYSWQQPLFWLSLSVLIYFGLNTFYFMLANYLFSTRIIGNISSYTHAALNIISNLLIAQAFRCHKNLAMN